jgi:hypothetical protein
VSCTTTRLLAENFTSAPNSGPYSLRGNAALMTLLDPTVPGRGVLFTALGQSNNQGSAAVNKTINVAADCGCGLAGGGAVVSANLTSGGGTRGDGVLLALVDASLQTPGSTQFMPAGSCGLAPTRPTHALIVEFDTYDDSLDATCTALGADGTSTGLRLVRTYGVNDAPVILMHALVSDVLATGGSCQPSCTLPSWMNSGAWWEMQIVLPTNTAGSVLVYTDGVLRFQLADNTVVPSSFYILSTGRTSTLSSDRNGVANVRADCIGDTPFVPDGDISHNFYVPHSGAGRATAAAAGALAALAVAVGLA